MKAEKNGIVFYGTPKEMAELFNLTEKEIRKQLKEQYYPLHPVPNPYDTAWWGIFPPTCSQGKVDTTHIKYDSWL